MGVWRLGKNCLNKLLREVIIKNNNKKSRGSQTSMLQNHQGGLLTHISGLYFQFWIQ